MSSLILDFSDIKREAKWGLGPDMLESTLFLKKKKGVFKRIFIFYFSGNSLGFLNTKSRHHVTSKSIGFQQLFLATFHLGYCKEF